MGILKSAADLVYTIRFLKMLVTPFEKMGAFEAGIIDKNGNKLVNKGSSWFNTVAVTKPPNDAAPEKVTKSFKFAP